MPDDADSVALGECRLGECCSRAIPFLAPLADSRNYPRPAVFVVPSRPLQAGGPTATWSRQPNPVRIVDHARTALFLVGKALAPIKVWAPAYHCPAMLEPLLAAGCEVALYPVTQGLEPELGFLRSRVSSGDAMIGTRFFGFDCGIIETAAFCHEHGLLLIEDLAHAAFFDSLHGQFAVTSLVKFLPVQRGGEVLLASSSRFIDSIDEQYRRLATPAVVRFRSLIERVKKRLGVTMPASDGFRYFDAARMFRGMTRADRRVLNKSADAEIRSRRQQNYRYLLQHLGDCDHGRPLFGALPDSVVPYVFPFLLKDAAYFDRLRRSGVQVLRWEEIAPSDCVVSVDYRERLVQLPLHQDLSRRQLDFIVSALTVANEPG